MHALMNCPCLAPLQISSKYLFLRYFSLGLFVVLSLNGCATPKTPTGGPEDKDPPRLLRSNPEHQALNVQTDQLTLLFNEYIEVVGFPKTVTITPSFTKPLKYKWHGKEATILFPEALRPQTTYVLTLNTELRDWNGVALKTPISIAFSTGETINRAEIAGEVLTPKLGTAAPNADIWAWVRTNNALPDLTKEADYRTQSDTEGRFKLSYLPETAFFVLALSDRNRNRKLDPTEAFALPPFSTLQAVLADTTKAQETLAAHSALPALAATQAPKPVGSPPSLNATPLPRWYLSKPDTTAPLIRAVRAISKRRIMLTLSESVLLTDANPQNWQLSDSLNTQRTVIRSLYQTPNNLRAIWLTTDSLGLKPYTLRFNGGIQDSTGHPLRKTNLFFAGVNRADTLKTRMVHWAAEPIQILKNIEVLGARQFPTLVFNEAIDSTLVRSYLAVTDTTGKPLKFKLMSQANTRFEVQPHPFQAGQVVRIRLLGILPYVKNPISRTYQRLPNEARGILTGSVEGGAGTVVEVYPISPTRLDSFFYFAITDESGQFVIHDLPEGQYRLRAFKDFNGNQRWDAGEVQPFKPAEPLTWTKTPIQVRPRWENQIETIKF